MKQAMTKGIFNARLKNINLPLLAGILLLAACSKDDNGGQTLPEGEYPMTFTARGIMPPVAQTRSTVDNNWEGVTQVSVQVGDVVKAYDVHASADDGYQTATITSENPFYWQSTDPVTVTAWYPYSLAFSPYVSVDQSVEYNYLTSDKLIAENQTLTFGQPGVLNFEHHNAKVTVLLQVGGNVTQEYLTDAKIYLLAATDDRGSTSTITPYQNRTAHLLPQTLVEGQPFILINIGDEMYSYTPETNQVLEGGTHYTYAITISEKQDVVELSCITTITPWEEISITGTANPDGIIELDFDEQEHGDLRSHYFTSPGRYLLRGTAGDKCDICIQGDAHIYLENFHGGWFTIGGEDVHPTIHISGENSMVGFTIYSSKNCSVTIVGEDVNSYKNILHIEEVMQVNDDLTIDNVFLNVVRTEDWGYPAIMLSFDNSPLSGSLTIRRSTIYAKTIKYAGEDFGSPGIGYATNVSPSPAIPDITISDSFIHVYRSEATYPGDYIGLSGSESYQGDKKIQTKGTITNSWIGMYTGDTNDGYRSYDASGDFTEYLYETENNE